QRPQPVAHGVPNYTAVLYRDVWAGVDLRYHNSADGQLEFDFLVAAGADPGMIRVAVSGAEGLGVDGQGNLVLSTAGGQVVQQVPVIYQQTGASQETVSGRYVLLGNDSFGFQVDAYDHTRPLVIDPILYSTYLGGTNHDMAYGIAIDASNAAYV